METADDRAAGAATHLLFPLNRADLLSWVDMGKTGSGFPGICHVLFNDSMRRILPRIHTHPPARRFFLMDQDQMNLAHLCNRPSRPNRSPGTGAYLCEMKTDPRLPCRIYIWHLDGCYHLRPMDRSSARAKTKWSKGAFVHSYGGMMASGGSESTNAAERVDSQTLWRWTMPGEARPSPESRSRETVVDEIGLSSWITF